MSVIVQRHGDIGMSHDVLQVFGVHPSVGEAGAEGMAHGMGRDVRQGLLWFVVLVVLPDKPLEHTLVPAKAGGAVNGGAYAPFILTVDWLGWLC